MIDKRSLFPDVFEDRLLHVPEALRESASRQLSGDKIDALKEDPIPGQYDLEHFAKIHKYLFQDVSSLAGAVRDYTMRKGNTVFADPDQMPYLFEKELPKRIEALNQSVNDKEKYIDGMTDLHSTLDLAHPFREGNGRSTRVFMSQLAGEHGYELEFEGVDRERWENACKYSIATGQETFKRLLFAQIVKPTKERSEKMEEIKLEKERSAKSALVTLAGEYSPENKQKLVDELKEQGITADDLKRVKEEIENDRVVDDPEYER